MAIRWGQNGWYQVQSFKPLRFVFWYSCAQMAIGTKNELQLDCKMGLLVWTSPHQSAT
jgi:hypothetical protein